MTPGHARRGFFFRQKNSPQLIKYAPRHSEIPSKCYRRRVNKEIIPASTPNINLKELVTVCIRPVIQAAQAQATSHTVSLCTDNQSYSQTRHRQPVIMSAQTQATSHTVSPGAGNQSYSQPRHRQPVIMSAQAQTTSHTASPGTGNLSSCQPRHKQPVIQSAQAQVQIGPDRPRAERKHRK